MLKFSTILVLLVTLCAADFSTEVARSSIRRAPAMKTSVELAFLNSDVFAEKLETMVVCYHEGRHDITFNKIKRLITQNPANANPYLPAYGAHLITLASRWRMCDVVQSIAENNQASIHCLDKEERTPLDEAIIFGNVDVVKYLHCLDASQNHTTPEQCKNLRSSKKRKIRDN